MTGRRQGSDGFTLLELMVVLGMLSVIAMTALPNYRAYIAKGEAAACLVNRRHVEMDQQEAYLRTNTTDLAMDGRYRCPSGGTLVWLVSDPAAPGYPMVVCSIHGPATTPPAAPPPDALFTSGFDTMDGLTPLQGKWALQGEALTNTGGGEHRLAFGDTAWTDYETTLRATLDTGKGYGVYYRADGERNITGYCFQYDPGYGKGAFIVRKVVDGKESGPIARVAIPEGYPVYGTAHDIAIAVDGDRHVIRIDGETLMDFQDASFASGATGLRTWGNTAAAFDSVSVRPLGS